MGCSGSRRVAPTPGSLHPEIQPTHPPLPAAGFNDLLLIFCGRLRLMRVEGRSMWPTLSPGDRVLLRPHQTSTALPERGSIVVAQHPHRPGQRLIKRLVDVDDHGSMLLLGDQPDHSTDSRQLGPIARGFLIGAVTKVIRRPELEESSAQAGSAQGCSHHSRSEHSG